MQSVNPESVIYPASGLWQRSAVLTYAVLSYGLGVLALLWLILTVGGLAPDLGRPYQTTTIAAAIFVNTTLILLFAVQHTIMARQAFKERLTRYIPQAMERSTFVLMSGIFLALAVWLWQPLPGILWNVEHPAGQGLLWVLFALGWGYLFAATFVTNHFELFGLRQAWLHFTGRPYTPLPFVRKYMYRYSRHPMMLGILVGIWSVPSMSTTQGLLAALLTLYVFIGVAFEERDLVARFGETYREYRKEIATLLPGMF